ncbi:anchored repeat-type ABC transporter permease subunit [Arcanobacterium pinnipediorum]|uniref:Anchored repeat-type ABC transporter permease subunit n=1 Tax=Arcanobacterium pinnipediorum TaxID=1503041 RepID=A0ABY5AHZ3_9ACTO|nr:anchored repeat-type ABC transporter permease subunit [Arcanobacterium pinnipediorum]USR79824.1 anchored repeat-type ABC transporter permease subunit [Arcanobacterium pinnipediorum]
MNLIDFLNDLTNPALSFLPRALVVAVLAAIVCGVAGAHVVLRGMSFVGDALAHAVFPGVAAAFALQGSILLGGAIAGVIVTLLITLFAQHRRLKEDSIIGVFFAAAFALGLVIMSRIPGYTGSLESFLFGSLNGSTDSDMLAVAGLGFLIIAVLAFYHRKLVAVSVDRDYATSLGISTLRADLVVYLAVAAAVVISVQTIGNILVLALLITPAAGARMLTDRVGTMMIISPAIGSLGAFLGIWASWTWDVPTGAMIVLILTAIFIVTWLFAPRRGVITGWLRATRER